MGVALYMDNHALYLFSYSGYYPLMDYLDRYHPGFLKSDGKGEPIKIKRAEAPKFRKQLEIILATLSDVDMEDCEDIPFTADSPKIESYVKNILTSIQAELDEICP